MIRFVDMRSAEIEGVNFGFWDTITDRMLSIGDDQGWESIDELRDSYTHAGYTDDGLLTRLIGLCPAWVSGVRDVSPSAETYVYWISPSANDACDKHREDSLQRLGAWARDLVAECTACRERGSKIGLAMWEWSKIDLSKPLDTEALRGWGTNIVARVACRPCPSCSINGQPTGRRK